MKLSGRKCPTCGKDSGFTVSDGRIKPSKIRKFCSRSCSTKFRVQSRIVYIKCPVCGKEFRKYPPDRVKRKHCSMECFNAVRSKNLPKYKSISKEHKNYQTKKINGKAVLKHRWVMEQHLGRKLDRKEVIHHINGDRHDNSIENLMILSQSQHMKI